MCTATDGTLTLAALLSDPLTQAMMRSDGVSQGDFTALLLRVKDVLADRADWTPPPRKAAWELAEA